MRPCTCELSGCRLCWLYHNDDRYRRLWDGEPQQELPPLTTQAANALTALVKHAANGFKNADPAEQSRRQELCLACPEYVNGRCNRCGCKVALKASWESEHCPIGKW